MNNNDSNRPAGFLFLEAENARLEGLSEIDKLRSQLAAAEQRIAEAAKILETADLCKLSDKLKWANAISAARVVLYHGVEHSALKHLEKAVNDWQKSGSGV